MCPLRSKPKFLHFITLQLKHFWIVNAEVPSYTSLFIKNKFLPFSYPSSKSKANLVTLYSFSSATLLNVQSFISK